MTTVDAHRMAHPSGARRAWLTVKNAVSDLFADDALILAAAVAYFTALSLAPLVILTIWVFSLLGQGSQQAVVEQSERLLGSAGAESVEMVIQNAKQKPGLGSIAGIVGIVTLLIGASAVFAQLQRALNTIFDVEPKKGGGARASIWRLIRQRLLSIGMLLVILFMLVISLVASAAIGFVTDRLPGPPAIWHVLNTLVSLVLFAFLFGAMFRLLPDVRLGWRDVAIGAVVTSLLFALGKLGLGLYLAYSSTGSSYGAAGSLVLLLVWVYYSSTILFLGAELTQSWIRTGGRDVEPDSYAQRRTHAGLGA